MKDFSDLVNKTAADVFLDQFDVGKFISPVLQGSWHGNKFQYALEIYISPRLSDDLLNRASLSLDRAIELFTKIGLIRITVSKYATTEEQFYFDLDAHFSNFLEFTPDTWSTRPVDLVKPELSFHETVLIVGLTFSIYGYGGMADTLV
jgi:hypothetical protein